MLKTIFLAPGWFLYRKLTQKRRKFRYLAKPQDSGPILKLSALFWVVLAALAWLLVSSLSGGGTGAPAAQVAEAAPAQAGPAQPAQEAPPGVTSVTGAPLQAAAPADDAQAPASDGAEPAQEGQEGAGGAPEAPPSAVVPGMAPAAQGASLTPLVVPEELRLAEDATTPLPEAWLVIVESVPKSARDKAEASLARQRRKGLDLVLVDTDAYPRLKSGMWALSMGPFDTKAEAEAAAANLKPKVRDLMVRRGL